MQHPQAQEPEIEVEHRDEYTAVTFLGSFSVVGFQRRAETASRECRDRKTGRLFVDATRYDVNPTIVERYEIACHAVKISAGLKVALLITPTFLDPNKFGIMVAQNRGLVVEAFTERQKAIEWLVSPATVPGLIS
jgi:hypothetical protein